MLSMRKLARLAGVSTSTVSRALHNDPRIRPATRQRIQALAEQYHYLPNSLSQGLLTGRTRMIGLILPTFQSTTYAQFLEGVLEEANLHGYHVSVAEGHQTIAKLRAIIDRFTELRADGIICRPGIDVSLPSDLLLRAYSYGTFVVGVDLYDINTPINHLRCDEEACAEVVLDYLLGLGHRSFAFVGAIGKDQVFGRGRFFQAAMHRRHLSTEYFVDVPIGLLDATRAHNILTSLLAQPVPPTAIICWDDQIAGPLVRQAYALGIAVPKRLSIIGSGNMALSEFTTPPLTSLELAFEERGRIAVRLIAAHCQQPSDIAPSPYQCINTPPRLIVRSSCAPPLLR